MRPFFQLRIRHTLFILVASFALQACSTSLSNHANSNTSAIVKPSYYIYLAGPEVFLPDPIGAGAAKKALINRLNQQYDWSFSLVGLYPMDNEIENFAPDFATGMKIYHANIELMDKADYITANMVRFRGPSMDVGTAFEMGYMRGLKKPVYAYYDAEPFYGNKEKAGLYTDRIAKFYPISTEKEGVDIHGQAIENFQMEDNLMMIGALESGSGALSESFEAAVLSIAEHIKSSQAR